MTLLTRPLLFCTERAKATADCPRQFGRYALPGAGCQRYKVCVKGEAWEMTCPANLMWNQANHMCDYPDLVRDTCPEGKRGGNAFAADAAVAAAATAPAVAAAATATEQLS